MSEWSPGEVPDRLTPGSSAAWRMVQDGRVWGARAVRVIEDDGAGPLLAHWPGAACKLPADYVASFRDPDPAIRRRLLEDGPGTRRELTDWTWAWTTVLTAMLPGEWFSVSAWSSADDDRFAYWYVNFEEPFRRSAVGVDTRDLILDLVVAPDGERSWKDEDEYRHARRIGVITEETHRHIEVARERASAMVAAGTGPFACGMERWRPDPTWVAPTLPHGWDRLDPPGDGPPDDGPG